MKSFIFLNKLKHSPTNFLFNNKIAFNLKINFQKTQNSEIDDFLIMDFVRGSLIVRSPVAVATQQYTATKKDHLSLKVSLLLSRK
jgi:hypothetical protein